jgi:uncharacterized OB-fold protein
MSAQPASFRPDVFSVDPLRLKGMRCGRCHRNSFPARESCPSCGSPDRLEARGLSTRGELCSWSVVRNAPAGLRTPYTLAYVDLPADGVRVMSRLIGVDDADLAVGQHLELTSLPVQATRVDADEHQQSLHMFAFRPSQEETR